MMKREKSENAAKICRQIDGTTRRGHVTLMTQKPATTQPGNENNVRWQGPHPCDMGLRREPASVSLHGPPVFLSQEVAADAAKDARVLRFLTRSAGGIEQPSRTASMPRRCDDDRHLRSRPRTPNGTASVWGYADCFEAAIGDAGVLRSHGGAVEEHGLRLLDCSRLGCGRFPSAISVYEMPRPRCLTLRAAAAPLRLVSYIGSCSPLSVGATSSHCPVSGIPVATVPRRM